MTLRQINTDFSNLIKLFTKTKQKVLSKFLAEMISGIIISRSVKLSAIARAIEKDSQTTSRHIFKKLDRNLGHFDTYAVKETVQAKQIALVDDNTLIYFDPTDIIKNHGKKFEALSLVADGSDHHKVKKGYPAVCCVALKNEELIPLEFDLFSYKEESFDSENQKLLFHIDTIAHRSRFKGTFVLDRGFDRFAVIRHLCLNTTNFILRLKENRHFYSPGRPHQSYHRADLINRHYELEAKALLDIRINKRLSKKLFTIKSAKVELVSGKIDSSNALTLIRAKACDTFTLYLLTNKENLSAESLIQIVQDYLNRWKVEEFIRFIKQQYGAEKFQVLSLGRIKNLFNLLFIAVVILTRLSELEIKFSKTRAILIKKARRTYKIPQKMKFFLYALADGLSELLKMIDKKLLQLWQVLSKNQRQLSLKGIQ